MVNSIKEKYNREVVPKIKSQFGFTNDFQVPKIEKVVINVGIGKYLKDSNAVKEISSSLEMITGQKAVLTKAKQSIAGFKIRQGLEVGIKVTLRGRRKWDFIERLVHATLPRIRDFQGIKRSTIDEHGNLNIGIKEHTFFPEILPENVKNIMSLQITVTTNAQNRETGSALFRFLGFPIITEN